MKKIILSIFFTFLICIHPMKASAIQFDVLVLPTEIFDVCENYFCFPEPSEVAANYIMNNLDRYNTINIVELSKVRAVLNQNPELKSATEDMLKSFEQTERIDFDTLDLLSREFGVKSVMLISAYAITDRSATRRNLWEVLEVTGAFRITYPFNLTTTVVLTDTVNNTVMWSNKYNKTVSDSNGYFLALNHIQASSHLEKIKQYYKNNVAQNVSQYVHLRFFPKDVKTFSLKNQKTEEAPQFMPNALEHLITPKMIKELEDGAINTGSEADEFIYDF